MKDYSAMSDLDINKAVASFKPEVYYISDDGDPVYLEPDPAPAYTGSDYNEVVFDPCNNPSDAWPIITSSGIDIIQDNGQGCGLATSSAIQMFQGDDVYIEQHENVLRAAMIVYLQMMEGKS